MALEDQTPADDVHVHACALDSHRSPARRALAALNHQIAGAQCDRGRALAEYGRHAPAADRLQALVAAHQTELHRMSDVELGAEDYAAALFRAGRLLQKIQALEPEVDHAALACARETLAATNERLSALSVEQQRHLDAAVLEALERFTERHLCPVWARSIRLSGVIEQFALDYEAAHPNIAGQIRAAAATAFAGLRVTADPPGVASRFFDELGRNPAAEIEVPEGETVYERVPVRSMADPLPDGSAFINRPPQEAAAE